jgi:tRNA-specific 2-thiouridylase
MARIAVAMSGGVDSLRSASLLQEMGHEVLGLHLRLLPRSPGGRWSAEETLEARERSVRQLASRFGIPLTIIDCRDLFEKAVIQPFLEAYRNGLTPNPCVHCNPGVKFPLILQEALKRGADGMATGHYARISPPAGSLGRYRLLRGRDLAKDQSYFLFGLTQDQLARVQFPLGDHFKQDVQRWAGFLCLDPELPKESQEICFIPSGGYQEFLTERHPVDPAVSRGPIIDREGNVLGEHKGLFAYTIGQRRGLGIASTAPLYVVELDVSTNAVRVGSARDLDCGGFNASSVNWVSVDPPISTLCCSVKIRHQHQPALARVTPLRRDRVQVDFETPQRAVAPGQAAVFYDGDVLLGGGIIEKPDPHRNIEQNGGIGDPGMQGQPGGVLLFSRDTS